MIQTERYTLHHGDCLDILPTLEAQSVDAIITDLPYQTTACEWDTIIPFEPMWAEVKRVLKPRGAFVTTASQPFTSKLIMSNLEWFKYCWVWEKPLITGFLDANRRPLNNVEDIVVFSSGQTAYNPQMVNGVTHLNGAKERKNFPSVYGDFSATATTATEYYPKRILKIANPRIDGQHSTQKPVALMEYLIRTYTNEGDVVLDFTAGSFTTGVACLNTNRKFVGIEKDTGYFDMGVNRMSEREDYLIQIGSIPLSYDKIDKGKSGYQARSLFEYHQIAEMEQCDEQI